MDVRSLPTAGETPTKLTEGRVAAVRPTALSTASRSPSPAGVRPREDLT